MVMGVFLVSVASVMAQEPGLPTPSGGGLGDLLQGIVASLVYSILGIVILILGFKILNWVTPFDLNKEIAEDDNVAVGVLVAGMMIGLGIIIAAAIL
jgi:hypothetical protein